MLLKTANRLPLPAPVRDLLPPFSQTDDRLLKILEETNTDTQTQTKTHTWIPYESFRKYNLEKSFLVSESKSKSLMWRYVSCFIIFIIFKAMTIINVRLQNESFEHIIVPIVPGQWNKHNKINTVWLPPLAIDLFYNKRKKIDKKTTKKLFHCQICQ